MDSEDTLVLKVVGYGTAQSNVGPMGNILHISVQEWFSFQDGPQIVQLDEIEATTVDNNGIESRDKVLATQTIHATWLPSGSNRFTAPNMRVGEEVEVLQQSDADIYYWRPLGISEKYRKLETVIWGISATKDESADSMDPNNRYWIEFSSHSKVISLTTSMANGEAARYSFSFNTGDGIVNLMDHKGNRATLESTLDIWTMATSRGCTFEMDKKDLKFTVPGNSEILTEGTTDINSVKGITLNGGGSTVMINQKGILLNGAGSTADFNSAGIFFQGGGSTLDIISGGIFWSGPIFQKK